ncbi:MAG: hypothetical protein FJ149_02015 [Euryarchaeota archaeon]|nr:hypothetical protein [Euryarchaeota archaeon]
MRNAVTTALVLAALLSCAFLPAAGAPQRAANELGDDWARVSNPVFSVSPLHVGDQSVTLGMTLQNLRPGDLDAANGDERMYCVTVEVHGVLDAGGRLLPPSASPVAWTVSRLDNSGNGFTLGRLYEPSSVLAVSGLRLDVKGTALPGRYNVSVNFGYSMMNSQDPLDLTSFNEQEDSIQFEILSNVVVGTPVPLDNQLRTVPLLSGASFQLIGISLRTVSGPLGQVVATLTVPPSGALQLAAPAGTTLSTSLPRLTGTATLHFRVDVPRADQGIYNETNANITLTLQYIRERNWNGSAMSIASGESGLPLVFTVDYTPLVNATDVSPSTFRRGTAVRDLTVTLGNEGNADLMRLKVSLDVSNYFTGGAYYYDGDGNRVPVPLEVEVSSLRRGGSYNAVYPMAVFASLPAGTHRLPVRYSGYFERAGDGSTSSGLYPMSDALFVQLRGELPAIEISVTDTATNLAVTPVAPSRAVLNPDGESEGVCIRLEVSNSESVAFRDASFTLLAGSGTILRDRFSAGAAALQPYRAGRLDPGETLELAFFANLDRAAAPGVHQLTLRFNATGADSNAPVSYETRFPVLVGPFGPALAFSSDPSIALGGQVRNLAVPVEIINSGGATLSGLSARLKCGSPTPLVNPSDASAAWLDARPVGIVGALETVRVVFPADLNPNATARSYDVEISLDGAYQATGERFIQGGTFALRLLPAPARLAVQGQNISPDPPRPGQSFTLTVRVQNVGGDTARGVWVALGAPSARLPGGSPPDLPGSPFSAEVAVKYIGELGPGVEVPVAFNVLSDPAAAGRRLYSEPVVLGFDGPAGTTQYVTVPVAIKLKAAQASSGDTGPDWTIVLLTLGFVALLVMLLAVLVWPPGGRARALRAEPGADGAEPQKEPMDIVVAKPVPPPDRMPELPDLPSPPPMQPTAGGRPGMAEDARRPVQPGELPPPPPPTPPSSSAPPVAPPVADGGKLPPGARPRPGPLEGYTTPGAEQEPRYSPPEKPKVYTGREVPMRNCPSCGNEVKMRFVKCPICGADLPPAL